MVIKTSAKQYSVLVFCATKQCCSVQVFLGGFATECEAVHAYDLAAFACEGRGAVTNVSCTAGQPAGMMPN